MLVMQSGSRGDLPDSRLNQKTDDKCNALALVYHLWLVRELVLVYCVGVPG